MHAECLRHIKNTVPNWEEIFDEVERDQQVAQKAEAVACKPDDATAADSHTAEPAPRGKTVKTSTHWVHSRSELLTPADRSQRPSESPSPLRLPNPQPPREDFWATVMGGASPSPSCGTDIDSELEHLLGGKPKSRDDLPMAGLGDHLPEAYQGSRSAAATETNESLLCTSTQASQKAGDMNNTSAVSAIHEDPNSSPIETEGQGTQSPSPLIKDDNDNDTRPRVTHVQQGMGLSETKKAPEKPHDDDQELDGHDVNVCNISDPWINYQILWGDDGVTKDGKSMLEDLEAGKIDDDPDMLQHALSLALLVSGNSAGGLPIRGRRDGSESPSKKRKLQ